MAVKKPVKAPRRKASSPAKTRKGAAPSRRKPLAVAEPVAVDPGIRWGWALGGLAACFVLAKFVLPYSAFIGFLSLGVATLVVGYALGRD